jgi:hypothetical protein
MQPCPRLRAGTPGWRMAGGGERISGGETARGWGSTCSYWARLSTRPTSVACVKCGVGRALAMRPGSWSELFGDQEFRKQIYHKKKSQSCVSRPCRARRATTERNGRPAGRSASAHRKQHPAQQANFRLRQCGRGLLIQSVAHRLLTPCTPSVHPHCLPFHSFFLTLCNPL